MPRQVGQWVDLFAPAQPRAVPPDRKNGTSDPIVAATSVSCAGRSGSFHRRTSPIRVAAASELPPPRPACSGMRLVNRTMTLVGGPVRRIDRHSASAARQHEVGSVDGHAGDVALEGERPSRSTHTTTSCSATAWKTVRSRGIHRDASPARAGRG
jgi:hypothetical protein